MALLGIGIYCQVVDLKEEKPTNTTTIQPGNQTTTTTTVKPLLDLTNANDTKPIIDELQDECKTLDDCVQWFLGMIHSGGLVLIIVSAVLIIITVIGMCGASNHNRCLLGIYFALILILLIAVAIVTIWAETTWVDGLKQKIKDNDVIPKEDQAEMDEIMKYINTLSLWALIPLMVVLVIIFWIF